MRHSSILIIWSRVHLECKQVVEQLRDPINTGKPCPSSQSSNRTIWMSA